MARAWSRFFSPTRLVVALLAISFTVSQIYILLFSDLYSLLPNLEIIYHEDGTNDLGLAGDFSIKTDDHGFKVTKPVNYGEKARLRIFAIGGSTTEQSCLPNLFTWPHFLQEKLDQSLGDGVEVVNAGLSGLRARHYLASLRAILSYHPDLVIFTSGGTDWREHIRRHFADRNPPRVNRHTRLGRLGHKTYSLRWLWRRFFPPEPIHSPPTFCLRKLRTLADLSFANKALKRTGLEMGSLDLADKRTFKPEAVWEEYSSSLEKIGATCKSAGVPCLFVDYANGYRPDLPEIYRLSFRATPGGVPYTLDLDSLIWIARLYNEYTVNFARRNGFPTCEVVAQMPPGPDYFFDDIHFNYWGSQRVAGLLFDCIREQLPGLLQK